LTGPFALKRFGMGTEIELQGKKGLGVRGKSQTWMNHGGTCFPGEGQGGGITQRKVIGGGGRGGTWEGNEAWKEMGGGGSKGESLTEDGRGQK